MKKIKGFRALVALLLAVMMVFGSVAAWAEEPLKTLEVIGEGETVQYKINGGSSEDSDQGIVSVDTIKNEDASSSALSIKLNDGTATVNTGDITQTDNKNDDIPPSNTVTIEVIGDDSELNLKTGNIESDFDGVAVQNGGGTIDITTKNITADRIGVNIKQTDAEEHQAVPLHEENNNDLGLGELNVESESEKPSSTVVSTGDITIGKENKPVDFGIGIAVKQEDESVNFEKVGTITVNAENAAIGIATGDSEYWRKEFDITYDDAFDVYDYISGKGTELNINAKGIDVTATEGNASGTFLKAIDQSQITTTIGDGGIQVTAGTDAYGAMVNAKSGAEATLTTTGGIVVNGEHSGVGIDAIVDGEGTVVTIKAEDITVNGDKYATGVSLSAGRTDTGGTINFHSGSIDAVGDDVRGVSITTRNANINMIADGDVAGTNYGLEIDVRDAEDSTKVSQIDALITGTLSGKDGAVLVESEQVTDTLTMTVWKAELNEAGNVAVADTQKIEEEKRTEVVETVEKNILYIIKVEQPTEGGTLTATDKDGKALNQSHGYDVAKEGERVLLKVNIADGYKLNGAYNGDGEKVPLLVDADGNYYVDVEKGGGVYLSVELEKIPEEKKEEKQEETTTNDQNIIWVEEVKENPVKSDPFDAFCNELVWKIRNAPQNGTVEADAGDFPGLKQKVFEALNDRPDVSLKLKTRDGEITIPAGAGLLEKVSRGVVTWAEIRGLV